jgi:hypothetical protein
VVLSGLRSSRAEGITIPVINPTWLAVCTGHYPWFATYNYLSATLPRTDDFKMKLCRSALIGFCASAVSDTISNSVRVIKVGGDEVEEEEKVDDDDDDDDNDDDDEDDDDDDPPDVPQVYRQANKEHVSYPEAVKRIVKEDGVIGLFGRGLKTKILANGLQGLMFSVSRLVDRHLESSPSLSLVAYSFHSEA